MPCYESRSDDFREAGQRFERENGIAISDVEALMCSACRALERLGYDFDENPLLSRWWATHKAKDTYRKNMEKAKGP